MSNRYVDGDNPVETIEFIDALYRGYDTSQIVLLDGKISFNDIPAIVALMPALYRGFVGIQYIDDELVALTDEGRQKIADKIAEFDIPNKNVEELVEETLKTLVQLVVLFKKIQDLRN